MRLMTSCAAAQLRAFTERGLRSLAALHAVGLAHCDVKPANVLLMGLSEELGRPDLGTMVLADFGLVTDAGAWLVRVHGK